MTEPRVSAVLLGGTSEIGVAILRELARDRRLSSALVGRDGAGLAAVADSLATVGRVDVSVHAADLGDVRAGEHALDEAFGALGHADVVIVAVGALGAHAGLDADAQEVADVLGATMAVAGRLMVDAARRLRDQGSGTLIVLSSVAGVRVRASNAVYGAGKAGLDALAGGVRDLVGASGARVLVVRPGFVVGRMTAGLPRPPCATSPETVARATVHAMARGRGTVWVPWVLKPAFLCLRLVPRAVWRRLPL